MNKKEERAKLLRDSIGKMARSKEAVVEANTIPEPTHNMVGGGIGYKLEDKLHLLTILNTYMLQDTYYKSATDFLAEFSELISKIALADPEFVAKAIVYSRCHASGLRTINQVASVLALPFLSGTSYAKLLYSSFDKKNKKGGMIYRPDDMKAILDTYKTLGGKGVMPNSMKKAFKKAIEELDTYSLLKYKKGIIDVANLVHPNPNNSNATVEVDGEKIPTITAIMRGAKVSADTWETGLSDVGQVVKEFNLSEEEKEQALKQGKNAVFSDLLKENKLGYLAAIRNINNIVKNDSDGETTKMLATLISDSTKIRAAKIMPQQLANAYLYGSDAVPIKDALEKAIEGAMANFKEAITGNVAVVLDVSGSMYDIRKEAAFITSILYQALNGSVDLYTFDHRARKVDISYFDFGMLFNIVMRYFSGGGTNLQSALDMIRESGKKYDRIIIISDNQANLGRCVTAYKNLITQINSPKIYSIDLMGYGESSLPIEGKIRLYFGKTFTMFDDMIRDEFNPSSHIEEVSKIQF
jgi:60 kDa SS-A/Ro ribonucleoprotein